MTGVTIPENMSIKNEVKLPGLSQACQQNNQSVQDKVMAEMNRVTNVDCMDSGQCQSQVVLRGCDVGLDSGRRKRSSPPVVVIQTISTHLSESDIFVNGTFNNETGTDQCVCLVVDECVKQMSSGTHHCV